LVVQAAPVVIDGHSGILGERFLKFVADRVFEPVQNSRASTSMKAMARPVNDIVDLCRRAWDKLVDRPWRITSVGTRV
jgi:hypothetical protein